MDFARRNNKDIFLFKVDFKKAFDLVSWDYLLYALKRVKFVFSPVLSLSL